MSTISLHKPASIADASHHVTAPGGYEWWYFDAEDPATDTQLVAIFLHGFPFHPGYLRSYFRYLRRPTRHAPPVPDDYTCAYFCVYRGGRVLGQFITHYPAAKFAARTDAVDVTIGSNRLQSQDSQLSLTLTGTPWHLTATGPKRLDQTLAGNLVFNPRLAHLPLERRFLSEQVGGAEHHWIISNPICDVSGQIVLSGQPPIGFNGRGYHDHNFGTGPIGPGLNRWFWGRVLLDDRALTFHLARPNGARLADEVHMIEADSAGMRESPVRAEVDWSSRSNWLLKYPRRARFGDALDLTNPRVIDSSPFYMRVMYAAEVRGIKTTALTEVAHPRRLRWPVLGRMVEMSIHQAE